MFRTVLNNGPIVKPGSIILGQGGGLGVPFKADLNTWHKGVDEITFNESINNLPARFLPRVAEANGMDDKTVYSGSEIADIINIKIKYSDGTWATVTDLVSGGTTITGLWQIVGTDLTIFYDGTNWFTGQIAWVEGYDVSSNLIFSSQTTGQGDHEYELVNENHGVISGTGTHYSYDIEGSIYPNTQGYSLWEKTGPEEITNWVNSDFNTFVSSGSTITSMIATVGGQNCYGNPSSGKDKTYRLSFISSQEILTLQLRSSDSSGLSGTFDTILNGIQAGLNEIEFTLNYNRVGFYAQSAFSDTQITNWSLVEIKEDIQSSFDINGDALSLTEGVNIPTGYTKKRDIESGGDKWNMADCLVDFDPN